MAHDVFISYGREDMPLMQQVEKALREAGLTIWTDRGIAPGSPSWKAEIEKAILEARCIVVLFSPDSAESRWVRAELDYADAQRKPIYPLLVRGDSTKAIPFGFTGYQWIDMRNPNQLHEGLEQLIAVLKGNESSLPDSAAETPVPARSRTMLALGIGLILAGLVLGLVLMSINAQTGVVAATPTIFENADAALAQPTALPTMPPFSVPDGFKKLEGKKTLIAVPTNWTTDLDVGVISDSLLKMAGTNKDAVDVVKIMLQNMDTVAADMLRFQGVAVTVEDFGVPISYALLDTRQRAMYQQVYTDGVYTSKGVEMPAGSMLFIESDAATTSLQSYILLRGQLVYSISFTYRIADKEAVASIADQIVRTFRVKE